MKNLLSTVMASFSALLLVCVLGTTSLAITNDVTKADLAVYDGGIIKIQPTYVGSGKTVNK